MRKLLTIIISICLTSLVLPFAIAKTNDNIQVYINNQKLQVSIPPLIKNNVALVQFRPIFEELEYKVTWNQINKSIVAEKEGTSIYLQINSNKAIVNGIEKSIDVAPTSYKGSTLVPLRFVGEASGCQVDWLLAEKKVVINKPLKKLTFSDNKIEEIVRKQINKPLGDITEKDVKYLSSLNIQDLGSVSNLDGIENLWRLDNIYIYNTTIENFDALKNVSTLKSFQCYRCGIRELDVLSNNLSLTKLFVPENKIRDLSVVTLFKELSEISIYGNPITDITPLKTLQLEKNINNQGFFVDIEGNRKIYPLQYFNKLGFKVDNKIVMSYTAGSTIFTDTNSDVLIDNYYFLYTFFALKEGKYNLIPSNNPYINGNIEVNYNQLKTKITEKIIYTSISDSYIDLKINNGTKEYSISLNKEKSIGVGAVKSFSNPDYYMYFYSLKKILNYFDIDYDVEFDEQNKIIIFNVK